MYNSETLRELYETATKITPYIVREEAEKATSTEERDFYNFIADMNCANPKWRHIKADDVKDAACYTFKCKSEDDATSKILQYYAKDSYDNRRYVHAELRAFLGCVVPFIHRHCKPEEFTLSSLIKLAETVRVGPKNCPDWKSPFDIIMEDAHFTDMPAYKMLCFLADEYTADDIMEALNQIHDYINREADVVRVRFVIVPECEQEE